jgi:hypothetical protein
MEEVWGSLPNWMKPRTKEQKSLKEGFEKAPENQDNMNCTSCFASGHLIGCSPFQANVKLGGFY